MDEDNLHDEPFEFGWFCENSSGGACVSRTGEALLELASGVDEAILYIAAGSLPIGELAPWAMCLPTEGTISKRFD